MALNMLCRIRQALLVLVAAFVLALPSAAEAGTVKVYFTKGEQMTAVKRDIAPGPVAAVTALLAGPTAEERKAGYGTSIPAGMKLIASNVTGGTVELTFSDSFGGDDEIYLARVSQVVYTATAAGATEIKLEGRTFTREDFVRPDEYVAPQPPAERIRPPADAKAVQTRLAALGYLPAGAVTGTFDYRTQQAVLAFQSWEGLARDGVVGPKTRARLTTAGRPVPIDKSAARHVEIYRARGVVLLIAGGRAVRAIHTSTGVGGNSPNLGTPPGRFKIYRKELRSWSVPYKSWLPFAAYWVGGWALHGYGDVPARPASHGCARLPLPEAKLVYDFVAIGTPVRVI